MYFHDDQITTKALMTTQMSLSSHHTYLFKQQPSLVFSQELPPYPPSTNEFMHTNYNNLISSASVQLRTH